MEEQYLKSLSTNLLVQLTQIEKIKILKKITYILTRI